MNNRALPVPMKVQLRRYGHNRGITLNDLATNQSGQRMKDAMDSVEGSLNSLSDALKNRFKALLTSQLSLLRSKEMNMDIKALPLSESEQVLKEDLREGLCRRKRLALNSMYFEGSSHENDDTATFQDASDLEADRNLKMHTLRNLDRKGTHRSKINDNNKGLGNNITSLEDSDKPGKDLTTPACHTRVTIFPKTITSSQKSYSGNINSSHNFSSRITRSSSPQKSPVKSPTNFNNQRQCSLVIPGKNKTTDISASRSPLMINLMSARPEARVSRYSPVNACETINGRSEGRSPNSFVSFSLDSKNRPEYTNSGSHSESVHSADSTSGALSPVRVSLASQLKGKYEKQADLVKLATTRIKTAGTKQSLLEPMGTSPLTTECSTDFYEYANLRRISPVSEHQEIDNETVKLKNVKRKQRSPKALRTSKTRPQKQEEIGTSNATGYVCKIENSEKFSTSTTGPEAELNSISATFQQNRKATSGIGTYHIQAQVTKNYQTIQRNQNTVKTHSDQQLQKKLLLNAIRTLICVTHDAVQRMAEDDFDFGIWAAISKNVSGLEEELEKFSVSCVSNDILPPEAAVKEAEDRLKTRLDVLFSINVGRRRFLSSEATRKDIMDSIQLLKSSSYKYGAATQNEMLLSEMNFVVKEIKDLSEVFLVCGERFSKRMKEDFITKRLLRKDMDTGLGLSTFLKKCFLGTKSPEFSNNDDNGHRVKRSSSLEALTTICCNMFDGMSDVQKALIILLVAAFAIYALTEFLSVTSGTIRTFGDIWNNLYILRYGPPTI